MTVHRWQSVDGNFGPAGSWDSGIAVADWGATDVGLLDGDLSQKDVLTGLDQSAEVIAGITTTRDYTGKIGSTGNPLKIHSTDFVLHSRGPSHIEPQAVASTVIVDSSNSRDAVTVYGTVSFVWVRAGKVTVAASTTCDSLGGMGVFGDPAHLVIDGVGIDGPQYFYVVGGELHNHRWGMSHATLASAWMVGDSGTLHQYGTLKSTSGNPPEIYNLGGRVILHCDTVAGSKKIIFAAGQVDMTDSKESFSSLADSLIGPAMLMAEAPSREAADIGFDLTDLRKDFPVS